MSGITPILDTLLHQVLGRRVDIPLARDLPEPVRPAAPGEAVQVLRSDSRLDGRASPPGPGAYPPGQRAPLPPPAGAGGQSAPGPGASRADRRAPLQAPADIVGRAPPGAPLEAMPAESGSTRIHFGAAARTIADLLARYPEPAAVIRPSAPLLSPAEGGEPARVASQLRASVDRSGVFYESHLGRWYRGEFSEARLAREPQMRLTRVPQPAGVPGQAGGGADVAQRAPAPAAPAVLPPAPASAAADAEESGSRPAAVVRVPVDASAGETLQGLMRHQLEILATSVLRWEGEVWSGMCMELVVQLPEEEARRESAEDPGSAREGEEETWCSRLTLRVPGLGEIHVRLDLRGDYLNLVLNASSGEVAARLDGAADGLRQRLGAQGFREILLSVENAP